MFHGSLSRNHEQDQVAAILKQNLPTQQTMQ